MDKYISREEAIKELREVYEQEYPTASGDFDEYASHDVPNVLRNIPAADVQPVKHGKWLDCVYDDMLEYWSATCSCCGNISTDPFCIIGSHKNCEHCGADMRGDTNE